MTCINHPKIPENTIEARAYQTSIAESATKQNTLVVLPTGMGKTAVALLVAANRIDKGKILMVAPTKPLVEQHLQYFSKNLKIKPEEICMVTGSTPSAKRKKMLAETIFCVATPEVIRNDLAANRYTLQDYSLLIVDECHRAVGNYAYVEIARRYAETATRPLILGMTASPGSDSDHVEEICTNLSIEKVESRTEDDPDVKPYVHERELEYITLNLPEELWLATSSLESMLDDSLERLKALKYPVPKREALSMKAINMLADLIKGRMAKHDKTAFTAMSIHAELLKLKHGIMLGEAQGSTALKAYLTRMEEEGIAGESKASKRLIKDERFQKVFEMAQKWDRELHPKADEVVRIVKDQLVQVPDSKIIVFVTYRDSVQMLVKYLNDAGISAKRFVGQAKRATEKGLSQKEQIEAIRQFREGEYTVLVATSVGEEGLDIPSTDLVVFYEAVPSEVRSIQRKGRTGRNTTGKVIVLVTKDTGDEMFRWVSTKKEKKMLKGVSAMRNGIVPHTTPPKPSESEKEPVETVQQTLDGIVAPKTNLIKNLKNEKEIAVDILTAFPLITKETAVNLLRTYGSLNAVLSASKEELLAVEGMEEKSASALLSMMKWKWRDQK